MQAVQSTQSALGDWIPNLLKQVSGSFEVAEPADVLSWAAATFREGLVVGTAFGASGMVLIDLVQEVCPGAEIFYIDTEVFFPETYALIERAQEHYGVEFKRITPEMTIEEQGEVFGERLWERDSDKCCLMRKVLPLRKALSGKTAWVTALRRDQALTRRTTPIVEWSEKQRLVKVSPLANWTEKDIWRYIMAHDVPYNPLHDQGYPSVGCQTCTRAVHPGEDLRAGRWAGSAKTECGLHV